MPTASSAPRTIAALLTGAAAAVIATLSASHYHRAYSPPLEVYDNERALLGGMYFVLALGLTIASLMAAWSRRSAGRLPARIVSVFTAVWLSAVLLYSSFAAQ
jgi:hypothetical protein